MLRLARMHVASTAVAEEVVQDTWVAVLRGLPGFEGRSTFRTWLLQIVLNRARSTGVREHRSIALGARRPGAVDPARFDATGAWATPPRVGRRRRRLDARALASKPCARGLETLPARQREVVMLRDVDDLTSEEVCAALEISEAQPARAAAPRPQPPARHC